MLMSFILDENPDWGVGHVIDLDAIIAHAVSLFDEVCYLPSRPPTRYI
jgi:hypothetical protein